jgi:uncharacterized membrane protein YgdD (TMEM256/DUF423 family)
MERILVRLGSAFGFVGVAAGAFGAHALRDSVTPARLAAWETAVFYALVHALAMLACACVATRFGKDAAATKADPTRLLRLAGILFAAGIVLFSGSLFVVVLADAPALGAITPIGGLCFLAGWTLLFLSVPRERPRGPIVS